MYKTLKSGVQQSVRFSAIRIFGEKNNLQNPRFPPAEIFEDSNTPLPIVLCVCMSAECLKTGELCVFFRVSVKEFFRCVCASVRQVKLASTHAYTHRHELESLSVSVHRFSLFSRSFIFYKQGSDLIIRVSLA